MIVKNQRNSGLAAGAAKNIVQTACIAVLGVTFGAAWGGVPATSAGGERPQADAAVTAESTLGECLEIDVQKGYSGGIFGHKGDDHYPMNGKNITHLDFQVNVKGHAAAHITKQDSTEVVVHYWYDAFSGVSYTLKVWVEC